MKRVVLTGTKDGSNVLFSLPEQSVNGGLTLFAHTNHLLHEVTGTPVPGEYKRLSASQIQVGLAPNADDPLYAFITTALSNGMEKVTLVGAQDGANVTFTAPLAAPAGSNFLVFLAGNILEETSAAPTVGQVRISGTTFTFGLAPAATDDVAVYREVSATALLRKLPLQGAVSSAGVASVALTASSGFTPLLLVIYTGLRIAETTASTPGATAYAASTTDSSLRVTLGLQPSATDHVDVYLIGMAEGAEDDVSPSLLSFRQLQRRLLVLMNSQIDVGEAAMVLDERWRNVQQSSLLSITKTNRRMETRAPKDTGTVTVTAGLDVVIGTGTTFTQGDVGLSIQLDQLYEIAAVDEANQYLYLTSRYAGTSEEGKAYRIVKRFYLLAPDVWRVLTLTTATCRLTECTQAMLNALDPSRAVMGEPYRYAYCGATTGGVERIELWPVPDARYLMHGVGLRRSRLRDPAEIIGDISNVLLNGGAAMACPIVANKKAAEDKIQAAQYWLSQANYWEGQYQALLKDFKRQDRRRFGEDDWNDRLFNFQGHPSYDLPVTGSAGDSVEAGSGFGLGGFGETPFGE